MNTKTTFSRCFPIGTKLTRGKIIPVFLPFAGCPFKCLYCAQDTQTGQGEISVLHALKGLKETIKSLLNVPTSFPSIEIAFYGGTFTALSNEDFNHCLEVFAQQKKQLIEAGFSVYGRCSTRPDCLDNNVRLQRMKALGIDLIELGIQSFNDDVLTGLGRAYTSKTAKEACTYLKKLGFYLGIQLMPSSPKKSLNRETFQTAINHNGVNECIANHSSFATQDVHTFHEDVRCALSFAPTCLRYYPCLVLENTKLASLWREQNYQPWDLQTCVDALGYALYLAWEQEVPVIRLSVAFEESFEKNVLAGIRHPALGSLIKARALRYAFKNAKENVPKENVPKEHLNCHVQKRLDQKNYTQDKTHTITQKAFLTKDTDGVIQLYLPKNTQGFIFGEKNTLKKEWENDILLTNIFFKDQNDVASE